MEERSLKTELLIVLVLFFVVVSGAYTANSILAKIQPATSIASPTAEGTTEAEIDDEVISCTLDGSVTREILERSPHLANQGINVLDLSETIEASCVVNAREQVVITYGEDKESKTCTAFRGLNNTGIKDKCSTGLVWYYGYEDISTFKTDVTCWDEESRSDDCKLYEQGFLDEFNLPTDAGFGNLIKQMKDRGLDITRLSPEGASNTEVFLNYTEANMRYVGDHARIEDTSSFLFGDESEAVLVFDDSIGFSMEEIVSNPKSANTFLGNFIESEALRPADDTPPPSAVSSIDTTSFAPDRTFFGTRDYRYNIGQTSTNFARTAHLIEVTSSAGVQPRSAIDDFVGKSSESLVTYKSLQPRINTGVVDSTPKVRQPTLAKKSFFSGMRSLVLRGTDTTRNWLKNLSR